VEDDYNCSLLHFLCVARVLGTSRDDIIFTRK